MGFVISENFKFSTEVSRNLILYFFLVTNFSSMDISESDRLGCDRLLPQESIALILR